MKWTVADVMTRQVVTVGPEADFKTCARRMQERHISALPVVDLNRKLVGIISEADLLAKERGRGEKRPRLGIRWEDGVTAGGAGLTAADLMTSPAICIAPDASIPQAARLMYSEAVKRLPVVDAKGVVVGIVSRADLLKTFTRSDEEIKREIVSDVITRALFIDPKSVNVDVTNGLVQLTGELETRSLTNLLVEMAGRVEGTVAVESALKWRLDDSRIRVEKNPRALQLSADER